MSILAKITMSACISLSKRCAERMIVTQQKEKTPTIQDAPSKNTYHVVNKNIAPSNVTDGLKTKEGMPSRGIPKLRLLRHP